MAAMRTWTDFPARLNRGYACAMIVHIQVDQLTLALLKQFDIFFSQYRYMYIGHLHE